MIIPTTPREARALDDSSLERAFCARATKPRLMLLLLAALAAYGVNASAGGRGRLVPLDVVIAIDDSGSQFNANGTDPRAHRYDAARFAARFLGSIATAGLDNRVGIVRFGSDAPADRAVPLSRVPRSQPQLDAALAKPRELGNTNFTAAIERAGLLFGKPQAGRKRVLLIFTDGVPNLDDHRSLDALFAQIGAAKDRLVDVEIDLLGVDDTGRFDDVAPRWRALGIHSVQRLSNTNEDVLAQAFAALLSKDLGLDRGDEVRLDDQKRFVKVNIAPYQEALVVTHFSPDPRASVEARAPNGRVAGTTETGRAGLLTVREPGPGVWTVRLRRGRSATMTIDRVPLRPVIRNPIGADVPVGRPLRIEATFQTSDGRVLPELAAYPRYFGAVVTDPSGASHPIQLSGVDGVYVANDIVQIAQTGRYKVTLSVKGAEREALRQTDVRTFTAAIGPYFETGTRTAEARRPLSVSFKLRLNGRDLPAESAVTDDPNAIGVARLLNAAGHRIETQRMRFVSGSTFEAGFSTKPQDHQRLTVTTTLRGTQRDGTPVSDQYRTVVTAKPTTSQELLDIVRTVVVVLVLVVLVSIFALLAWWRTRPHVRIRVRVDGKPYQLNGRGYKFASGSVFGRGLWIWGTKNGGAKYRYGRIPLPFGATTATSTRSERGVVG